MSTFVQASQERFIIHDVPEAVLDLFEPDGFTVQGLGEEGLIGMQSESPGITDASHFEMPRILWRRNPLALTPTLVVLETTGGFESPTVAALAKAGIPVVVANPRQVRDFAKALGRLAKTDALDAAILAEFAQRVRPEPGLTRRDGAAPRQLPHAPPPAH